MTREYNSIVTELLFNSDDKEYINAFTEVLINRRIGLEVIYLSHQSLHISQNDEINKLLKRILKVRQDKFQLIKRQYFEKAASLRDEEKEIIEIFEKYGYSLDYFNDLFVLYNVSINKQENKITLRVFTESQDCIDFIEGIKATVMKD